LGSGSGYSRASSGFPHSMICIARMIGSSGFALLAPPRVSEQGQNGSLYIDHLAAGKKRGASKEVRCRKTYDPLTPL
jgi:hypothetical protein